MHKVTVSPELLKRGRKSTGANSLGDMVSIRYGFHPDSLDHKSKMQLEQSDKDKAQWVLRGSGGGNGTTHTFSGGVAPASDLECVLVWDASSNSYVLHPLDATLRVSRDKAAGGGAATGAATGAGSSRATRTASPESTDGLGISLPGAGKIVSEEELRKKREIEAREAKAAAAAKAQAAEEAAEAARLEAELMEADMGLEEEDEVKEVKPEPVKQPEPVKKAAPKKAAPKKTAAPKKAAPKPAAKRPPTSTPTAAVSSSESDVDADLDDFGDLANELEESLEQFSKDDDGDTMMIVDDSHDSKPKHSWNMPAGGGGPMSLRGYAGGRREEEELSSSEEE